jgi:hypothetical protein
MQDERLLFLQADLRDVLRELNKDPQYFQQALRCWTS